MVKKKTTTRRTPTKSPKPKRTPKKAAAPEGLDVHQAVRDIVIGSDTPLTLDEIHAAHATRSRVAVESAVVALLKSNQLRVTAADDDHFWENAILRELCKPPRNPLTEDEIAQRLVALGDALGRGAIRDALDTMSTNNAIQKSNGTYSCSNCPP